MAKMSRQKFKYLENRKWFQGEIKSTFHNSWRAIIAANKKNFFLKGESPTLTGQDKQGVRHKTKSKII